MTLAEFVKSRRDELGFTWNDIANAGIDGNTYSNIVKGKQLTMRPATMQKFALLLKCSAGDIQACMAETQNPLRKEAAKKEGLHKTQPVVEEAEPEEEPENIFDTDPETSLDDYLNTPFPEYKSVYEEDRLEGEARYKQKLRDMCLRIFATGVPGTHTMKDVYADIGYALVKELAGGAE